MTFPKLSQFENAPLPIVVTLAGITTQFNPSHPKKAHSSIIQTLLPRVRFVKFTQPRNAFLGITSISFEIKAFSSFVQPPNAFSPMD